jgi:uncharacterized protein YndB with AHSA1/START domain
VPDALRNLASDELLVTRLHRHNDGSGATLTLAHPLTEPAAVVWQWITAPELLAQWSPIVPDRPLTTTGTATARETPDAEPNDADVLLADAPHELVHRWGPTTVRWTLAASDAGCVLTLEQQLAPDALDQASMMAAGWHLCFAVLTARLDGRDIPRVVGHESLNYGWNELNDRYERALNR